MRPAGKPMDFLSFCGTRFTVRGQHFRVIS
jgi:hypothetical protein